MESTSKQRDPRRDPRPGDVVRGKWSQPGLFKGLPNAITCEAVCGTLIAISSPHKGEISWIRKEEWCPADAWVKEYEVLHVAES